MLAFSNAELVSLTRLMQKMLLATEAAEWDELSRLDSERRALLNYTSEHKDLRIQQVATSQDVQSQRIDNIAPENDPERAALIEEITILDQKILASAQSARKKLLDKNHDLSAQVKAKNLYAQTSQIG